MNVSKCLSTLFLLICSSAANSAVIDFEQFGREEDGVLFRGYTEKGFFLEDTVGSSGLVIVGTESDYFAGSASLAGNTINGVLTLTQVNGSPFDLISIDLAEVFGGNPSVTFTADNGAKQTFTLDGIDNQFETVLFDERFSGISMVSWVQASPYHQVDNIVVRSVPLPSAGALGWMLVLATSGLKYRRVSMRHKKFI